MKACVATVAVATCSLAFLTANKALAGADYCHTNDSGNYVCIQSVFGPRSNRGMVYTVNGIVYASRINCYGYNYDRTSMTAIACWAYEGISKDPPKNFASLEAKGAAEKAVRSSGIADPKNVITPEKIKKNLPLELK